jgi:hypothetical protein
MQVSATHQQIGVQLQTNAIVLKPMTVNQFKELSLNDLAKMTGMDKTRWSKYFNGQLITEGCLNHLALKLSMKPHELLFGLNEKRLHTNAISAKVRQVA